MRFSCPFVLLYTRFTIPRTYTPLKTVVNLRHLSTFTQDAHDWNVIERILWDQKRCPPTPLTPFIGHQTLNPELERHRRGDPLHPTP